MTRARGAERLKTALALRHPSDFWLLAFEVPPAAGFEHAEGLGGRNTARADAIAFALAPCLGLKLIGYELKVNRCDWLRELETPGKARPFLDRVDSWWVASLPGVVRMEEVPSRWGWLVLPVGGSRLAVKKSAPRLGLPERSRIIDRSFAAILFQRARRGGWPAVAGEQR